MPRIKLMSDKHEQIHWIINCLKHIQYKIDLQVELN